MEIAVGLAVMLSAVANIVAIVVLVRSLNDSQAIWRDIFSETIKQHQRTSHIIAKQVDEIWRSMEAWRLTLHGIQEVLREIATHQEQKDK